MPRTQIAGLTDTVRNVLTKAFIAIELENHPVHALVDSGACASVITNKFRNQLKLPIEPYEAATIRLANGQTQTVLGSVSAKVSIGDKIIDYNFIVLPFMNQSVILGLNFLQDCGAVVNCPKRTISFFDDSIILNLLNAPNRPDSIVMLAADCILPANTETVTNVRCTKRFKGLGIIKPTITTQNSLFTAAKILVHPRDGKTVCRLINPTTKPIYLNCGQVVANIESITASEIMPNTAHATDSTQPRNLEVDTKIVNDLGIKIATENLTPEQHARLIHLLARNRSVFAKDLTELSCTTLHEHVIDTGDAKPTRQRSYPQSPAAKLEIQKQVEAMLANDIIEPADSAWSSSVLLIRKRSGEMRFCVDYRSVNALTKVLYYPLPMMSTIIETMGEVQPTYFSALDMRSGYWQLAIEQSSKPKTAFSTPHGQYQFKRMAFGLAGAPGTFSLLMNKVFTGMIPSKILVYLDDLLVFTNSYLAHEKNLEEVFTRLRSANLKLNGPKSHFCQTKVPYLGHVLSAEGVAVDPTKMDAFRTYPVPKTVKHVRGFLGYTGFYRKFVEGYAKIAAPLYELLKKDTPFKWIDACQKAFETLKEKMLSSEVLAFPNPAKPFVLTTDGCDHSIGYVLSQEDDQGHLKVVACNGRALRPSERSYSTVEYECLSLVTAVKEYAALLSIMPFRVITDSLALTFLRKIKATNGRLLRWSLLLQSFQFTIEHKKGALNSNADSLSRRPYPDPGPEDLEDDTTNDDIYFSAITELENHVDTSNVIEKDDAPTPGVYIEYFFDYGASLDPSETKFINTNNPTEQNSCALHQIDKVLTVAETPITDVVQSEFEQPVEITDDLPNLAIAQRQDPDLKRLLDFIEDGSLPENPKLARLTIYESENYFPREDGVLCHRYIPSDPYLKQIRPIIEQIVIPQSLQLRVLQQFHDNFSHPGFDRTFNTIRERFYYRQMYTSIRKYVNTCPVCQRSKIDYHVKKAPLQPLPVVGLFERWHADLLGPLKQSVADGSKPDGYKHILVMVDSLSRWPVAVPLKTQEASEIADAMWTHCFSIYGRPASIMTDRGKNLMGNVITALSKLFDVARLHTSSYNPKANSCVEKVNETISKTLRCYCENQPEWPEYLPAIMAAFRATPAISSTQFSPFMILHGFEMPLELDREYASQPSTVKHKNADDYITKLLPKLEAMRAVAAESVKHHQEIYKEIYDRKAEEKNWPLGTKVLLHSPTTPVGLTPKLYRRYGDVWYLAAKVGPVNYILRHSVTHKQLDHPIHVQRLRLYHDEREQFEPKNLQTQNVASSSKHRSLSASDEDGEHLSSPLDTPQVVQTTPTDQPPASTAAVDDPLQQQSATKNTTPTTLTAEPTAESTNQAKPPDTPSQWYEATQLLAIRKNNNKRQYKVAWVGFPPSWEDEDNISDLLKQQYHIKRTLEGRLRKEFKRHKTAKRN